MIYWYCLCSIHYCAQLYISWNTQTTDYISLKYANKTMHKINYAMCLYSHKCKSILYTIFSSHTTVYTSIYLTQFIFCFAYFITFLAILQLKFQNPW